MKSWKQGEVKVLAYLSEHSGLHAYRTSRALRGEEVDDGNWGGVFSIEVKTTAPKSKLKYPAYLAKWMIQAVRNAHSRIPIIVWHIDNTHYGEEWCLIRISDLVAIVKQYVVKEENNSGEEPSQA